MKKESILKKIFWNGTLILDAPLLIGSGHGSEDATKDIEILTDGSGVPYIPGTSIAGVLRAFAKKQDRATVCDLFGTEADEQGRGRDLQSAILLDDVKLSHARITLRDGVSIDGVTGTAIPHHKYDYEAVAKGARGTFSAEITLRGIHLQNTDAIERLLRDLRHYLVGGFQLGALTAKGFGRVHVLPLTVDIYDFQNPADVRAYLSPERQSASRHERYEAAEPRRYADTDMEIDADFALKSSLIVRDYDAATEEATDDGTTIHAVMKKDENGNYLIPGTSLKGVLRHHAAHLLHVLGKAPQTLEAVMGPDTRAMQQPGAKPWKSRFHVDEATLKDGVKLAKQTRNRIDRFTGGTIDSALFTTSALFQKTPHEATLHLHFGIADATPADAGLALLLLKDLWLGRVALGGETSIGRGTLEGRSATISFEGKTETIQAGTPVAKEIAARWQGCVDALASTPENIKEADA